MKISTAPAVSANRKAGGEAVPAVRIPKFALGLMAGLSLVLVDGLVHRLSVNPGKLGAPDAQSKSHDAGEEKEDIDAQAGGGVERQRDHRSLQRDLQA